MNKFLDIIYRFDNFCTMHLASLICSMAIAGCSGDGESHKKCQQPIERLPNGMYVIDYKRVKEPSSPGAFNLYLNIDSNDKRQARNICIPQHIASILYSIYDHEVRKAGIQSKGVSGDASAYKDSITCNRTLLNFRCYRTADGSYISRVKTFLDICANFERYYDSTLALNAIRLYAQAEASTIGENVLLTDIWMQLASNEHINPDVYRCECLEACTIENYKQMYLTLLGDNFVASRIRCTVTSPVDCEDYNRIKDHLLGVPADHKDMDVIEPSTDNESNINSIVDTSECILKASNIADIPTESPKAAPMEIDTKDIHIPEVTAQLRIINLIRTTSSNQLDIFIKLPIHLWHLVIPTDGYHRALCFLFKCKDIEEQLSSLGLISSLNLSGSYETGSPWLKFSIVLTQFGMFHYQTTINELHRLICQMRKEANMDTVRINFNLYNDLIEYDTTSLAHVIVSSDKQALAELLKRFPDGQKGRVFNIDDLVKLMEVLSDAKNWMIVLHKAAAMQYIPQQHYPLLSAPY